ncbi:MAG: hypothetical protein IKR14_04705, partial [Lachnospiraceae bacterium]|nr:hypothetical protein [Lachnospiraceae bacterium]
IQIHALPAKIALCVSARKIDDTQEHKNCSSTCHPVKKPTRKTYETLNLRAQTHFLPSFYPTLQKSANIPMPLISSSHSVLDSLSAPVWLLLKNHRFLEGAQKIPRQLPAGEKR